MRGSVAAAEDDIENDHKNCLNCNMSDKNQKVIIFYFLLKILLEKFDCRILLLTLEILFLLENLIKNYKIIKKYLKKLRVIAATEKRKQKTDMPT